MTDEYESPLDKMIREARERGAFDNLPGKGKPVQWEDGTHTPDDMRLANRVIKNSGFTLDWIEIGRELDSRYAAARQRLEAARLERAGGRIDSAGWRAAARAYAAEIEDLNKRIIGYNLRAPGEQFSRRPYPIDPDVKGELD